MEMVTVNDKDQTFIANLLLFLLIPLSLTQQIYFTSASYWERFKTGKLQVKENI